MVQSQKSLKSNTREVSLRETQSWSLEPKFNGPGPNPLRRMFFCWAAHLGAPGLEELQQVLLTWHQAVLARAMVFHVDLDSQQMCMDNSLFFFYYFIYIYIYIYVDPGEINPCFEIRGCVPGFSGESDHFWKSLPPPQLGWMKATHRCEVMLAPVQPTCL